MQVLRGAWPLEILTPEESGQADRLAAERGHAGVTLMEAAGRAVARVVSSFGRCRVLVLCGPGNNGGDGYVAARLLAAQGWPVQLAALAPPRPGSDAERAARRWHGGVVPFTPQRAAQADLVIDAVFGAGLSRDLDGAVIDTLRAARRVVAVDVPSGLDGATGLPRGYAPTAEATVTFFRLKPGHVLLPGRVLCGRIVLADIGLPCDVLPSIAARIWFNQPGLWQVPDPAAVQHKYSRGHVTVLGGAQMTGAARLASASARHGGAGMVSIAASGAAAGIYRLGEPGVIVTEEPLEDLLADQRRNAWVCGPGLGVERARQLWPLLARAGRLVVGDADLFSAFAGQPEALRGGAVFTPHEGEFARMFGPLGGDRIADVRRAAQLVDAVVLLKGPCTVIAAPDGRVALNASAPPWLATAGSGDVLSGLLAALLGTGMPAWEAACAAAWVHGRAGDSLGPLLLAEDLPGAIRQVLVDLRPQGATGPVAARTGLR